MSRKNKLISLDDYRVKKEVKKGDSTMKATFDVDEFFGAIMEHNRRVEEKKRTERRKANRLTKRRYNIKDIES